MTHPNMGYSKTEGLMLVGGGGSGGGPGLETAGEKHPGDRTHARCLSEHGTSLSAQLWIAALSTRGATKQARSAQAIRRWENEGSDAVLDSGNSVAARDQVARIRGRLQHPEGLPRDVAAASEARPRDSLRDRSWSPDVGRLRDDPPWARSAFGIHRHARIEPGNVCGVRQR